MRIGNLRVDIEITWIVHTISIEIVEIKLNDTNLSGNNAPDVDSRVLE
jgi:hypothetical protein